MFLKLTNIRKRYEGETIIDKITFTAGANDKIGLIGKNGAGKTTLLKMIAGLEIPTSGAILKDPPSLSVLYHQQVIMKIDQTIKGFILSSIPSLGDIQDQLATKFSADLLHEYENRGGYKLEGRIGAVLSELGLTKYTEDTLIKELSGGERTRLQLAPVILSRPDLLLLDEPTNHLDIQGLKFLEQYINAYKGIVITATHDKAFLTNCTNRIIEIEKGHLFDVHGNYTIYLREKELSEDKAVKTYKKSKKELGKLEANLDMFQHAHYQAEHHQKIKIEDNDKMGFNFLAERAAKKYSRRIEVLSKKIKTHELNEQPTREWMMKLDLSSDQNKKIAFEVKGISKSYPGSPLLSDFSYIFYTKEKTILIGKNGSGKSTLLKILLGEVAPDSGIVEVNQSVRVGYLSQDHLEIKSYKTILEDFLESTEVNEPTARTYLHKFLFTEEDVFREISTLSQGEKAKYAFAKMLFKNPTYLLLDEPTNYMDIESKNIIETTLRSYEGGFILASHDRALIQNVTPDKTLNLEDL
jgi:ATP-binding cassette subfamily F protein 3